MILLCSVQNFKTANEILRTVVKNRGVKMRFERISFKYCNNPSGERKVIRMNE